MDVSPCPSARAAEKTLEGGKSQRVSLPIRLYCPHRSTKLTSSLLWMFFATVSGLVCNVQTEGSGSRLAAGNGSGSRAGFFRQSRVASGASCRVGTVGFLLVCLVLVLVSQGHARGSAARQYTHHTTAVSGCCKDFSFGKRAKQTEIKSATKRPKDPPRLHL